MANKQYLGDGVFVERSGHELILTAEGVPGIPHGRAVIVLTPEVFAALVRYERTAEG